MSSLRDALKSFVRCLPLCGVLSAVPLIGASAAPAAAATVVDRIVAVVNKDIILLSELDQLAQPTFRDGDLDSPDGRRKYDIHRRKILDQLIEKQLVADQAKEMKLSVTEEEVRRASDEVKRNNNLDDAQFLEALKSQGMTLESYKKQLKQQILELKVISQAVRSHVSISEDEVRAFYAQTVRQAAGDDAKVRLRLLLVPVPEGAQQPQVDAAQRRAQGLLDRARGGEALEALAKQVGGDPLNQSGGDLGMMSRSDLPQNLREVVSSMDTGDLRGPVRGEKGFLLVQLIERKEADARPLDEVKDKLRRQLYEQQVEKSTQNWLKDLRRKAHVDIRL